MHVSIYSFNEWDTKVVELCKYFFCYTITSIKEIDLLDCHSCLCLIGPSGFFICALDHQI